MLTIWAVNLINKVKYNGKSSHSHSEFHFAEAHGEDAKLVKFEFLKCYLQPQMPETKVMGIHL